MRKITLLTALCLTLSTNATQICNSDITATSGPFTVNIDNTVTDNATGLTWMRCSLGQTGSDCGGGSAMAYMWAGALNEVANNYSGWRLPSIQELRSIVERQCYDPAINTEAFPSTINGGYWSSSPDAYNNDYAWGVSFDNGYDASYVKYHSHYVRLVRGGQ